MKTDLKFSWFFSIPVYRRLLHPKQSMERDYGEHWDGVCSYNYIQHESTQFVFNRRPSMAHWHLATWTEKNGNGSLTNTRNTQLPISCSLEFTHRKTVYVDVSMRIRWASDNIELISQDCTATSRKIKKKLNKWIAAIHQIFCLKINCRPKKNEILVYNKLFWNFWEQSSFPFLKTGHIWHGIHFSKSKWDNFSWFVKEWVCLYNFLPASVGNRGTYKYFAMTDKLYFYWCSYTVHFTMFQLVVCSPKL